MSYEKYYPGGWQSGESGGTPITPEALNHMEDGILHSRPDTWLPELDEIGAASMKLLWQNASPSSTFAAQDITISDISAYKYLLMQCGNSATCVVENITGRSAAALAINGYSSTMEFLRRGIAVTGSGIKIGNAFFMTITGGYVWVAGETDYNSSLIPLSVYGIG